MQNNNIFIHLAKRIIYYYPFTLTGTILFLFACLLLWNALSWANPFSFILAVSSFTILISLSSLSRLQGFMARKISPEWKNLAPLYARAEDGEQLVFCKGLKIFPFFRTHFVLKGRFYVAKKETFLYFQEFSSINPEKLVITLYFPLCGFLEGSGFFLVKDIFGLTRARFSSALQRTLIVHPPRLKLNGESLLLTMDGLEDTIRKKDASEERYYQREYMAGDKLRDINWKVSERISTLITKVSHLTQEKTRRLTIFFRNFRLPSQETKESLVHLNVIKGWLISFIRTIMQANPDYNFEIITVQDKMIIENPEDIERLSLNLSTLNYSNSNNNLYLPHPGEVFIFTTPFDRQLPQLVADLTGSRVYIFCTTAPPAQQAAFGQAEQMIFSLLKPLLISSLPGFWALRKEKRMPAVALPAMDNITVIKKSIIAKLL
jgi:hypothetical protein